MGRLIDALHQLSQLDRRDVAEVYYWLPEFDFGYLKPARVKRYGEDYFKNYEKYLNDPKGKELNKLRVEFVRKHLPEKFQGTLLDFGACTGQFVEAYNEVAGKYSAFGYDINHHSQKFLRERGIYRELSGYPHHSCMTFWDSLEHVSNCWAVLNAVVVGGYVFISIPIVNGPEQSMKSKHFKPGEHYWYFTRNGFVNHFMPGIGFELLEESSFEQKIGRVHIESYAFKRIRGMYEPDQRTASS